MKSQNLHLSLALYVLQTYSELVVLCQQQCFSSKTSDLVLALSINLSIVKAKIEKPPPLLLSVCIPMNNENGQASGKVDLPALCSGKYIVWSYSSIYSQKYQLCELFHVNMIGLSVQGFPILRDRFVGPHMQVLHCS